VRLDELHALVEVPRDVHVLTVLNLHVRKKIAINIKHARTW
jgi:hypothetical protein